MQHAKVKLGSANKNTVEVVTKWNGYIFSTHRVLEMKYKKKLLEVRSYGLYLFFSL